MPAAAGAYLFLLGLASGLALLTVTSYRHVSPTWLKWLLTVAGFFVISRYVTMALFTAEDAPQRFWALRHCWFATSVGLTLPGVFAIDQLLRHPALTPKTLLRWFSPFLAVYAAVILFGSVTPARDPSGGWTLHLDGWWRWLVSVTQGSFVLGFIVTAASLMRKIPSLQIRIALLGLILGYGYLAFDGVLVASGRSYFRPFLFSEMVTLIALWHAYETSARLQS